MKNTSLFRRILSVALVIAMLGSFLVPVASAEPGKVPANAEELTLTPTDPGAMESRKLGQTEAEDSVNKEDHALTDVVRVSIVLDKPSTLGVGFDTKNIATNRLAKAYRQGLRAEQKALTARIEKAIGGKLDVQWNLTLAANNISANVLYGQIDAIKAVDGVKDVFLENRYEPQTAAKADEPNNGSASYMIGSNIVWANGYTGAGSKVAVIDTGADVDHQSFSGEGLEYALAQNAEAAGLTYEEYIASLNLLTAEKIAQVADQLNSGADADQAYFNTKVGYGYNYVDRGYDIVHINDTQGEHGSHVSGISTANRFIKVNGEFKPALEAVGTQGVAPDAQLVVMKVFGKNGGAYDSDYMVAIEDAIVLGCDSANLSLGSGTAGFSFSDGYEDIMNGLVENGMVVAFSAGNSYGWYDTPYNEDMYSYLYTDDMNYATGGSPGSFTNALTVASVNNAGQTGMPLIFGDKHVFYSETSGYGNEPIATLAGKDYEYVLIDSVGVDDDGHVGGEGDDFAALGSEVLTGKIAMCFRGSSSFYAKANAAVAQGAVGVIIINNQDGIINMNLTGYEYDAPAVSILQNDGLAIMDQSEKIETEDGQVYYTGSMSIADALEVQVPEISDTVEVSAFSSWGTPGTMVLKPEILAPGGSIYSVNGLNNGGGGHDQYEVMSGTSMASPQVAGMAAVMGQYIRENGLCEKTGLTERQLINSLLMSTSHPVYDSNGNYWPVIRVGSGLANVGDATAAQSYILMDETATMFPDSAKDGKVKAELGDDPDYTGEYSFSFTVNPIEGQKEFTLRTDIFTQGVAGDGGYGLLQDQGTLRIGADVTYEVNGETYEDAYLIEADVNKDEVTDEADAQAILDYITGKLAEDAAFDAAVADVDGDGKISSYDAKLILDSAATPTIETEEPTKVTVNIKLDEEWMALLLNYYFTKGFYVEGYTYVDPVADEEGAMDVVHSIPIFGYCGSWTDPAMLDRTSVIDEAYGTGKLPYMANTNINYLSMKDSDGETFTYMGNPYIVEDKFPADRLAMNSNDIIASYNYLPIRNLATLGFALQDENGKVIYASATPTQRFAPYYYVNGGAWQNVGASNYNVGKKLSAMGVREDDKVTVGFYALPEYYGVVNAAMNGKVAASGSLDADGLKAIVESGIVGDGAGIRYNVVIDDTAPEVKGAFRDLITGDIKVMASDNNYIAYVGLLNNSGTKEYLGMVPAQTEPGEQLEIPLELDGIRLPNEVTLLVGDYAGNEVAFKINLGGSDEETEPVMIGFVRESTAAAPGDGNRAWEIDRENLWYNYSAGDYEGLNVYSSIPAAVTAAEYVDGYVFMAAEDGWFYAGDANGLDEASRVGKYSDTVEKIYDMAFNYKDKTLYVLGSDNVIYTMDLITGKLTAAIILTLDGVSGSNAVANRLAIDDNNTFYVANYGGTSAAKLFKFTYVASVSEEEPEVTDNVLKGWYFESEDEIADWTILDRDGDGYTYAILSSASYSYDGDASLADRWNTDGPDDWAITPAIDLSELTTAGLSYYAACRSTSYPETMTVYIGHSADPDEMEVLVPETTINQNVDSYMHFTVDLSDYIGEEPVYIGFRHYNAVDQYYLHLDNVEILGEKESGEPEPEVPAEVEPEAVTAEAVGIMGVYNYNNGGAMTWDHEKEILYLASNYNNTQDYDHYLWTVNTETGKAAKANTVNGAYSARLYGAVTGLLIIPGTSHIIHPTDEATELVVEPEAISLLKGQTVTAAAVVLPWTVSDKTVTWESADPAIATVKDGKITGVAVGETTITVTTSAEPHLTQEIAVTVEDAPEAEIRGLIWDEDGRGMASVFNTNAPADWTGEAQIGNFVWGALVDDVYYASTDDTMYAVDADTYEVTPLGGIVSMWIPSDAAALPADLPEAWGITGRVAGLCYNGTYFEILDPEAGNLNYWDLSDDFGDDPMALIAYAGRTDYVDANGDDHENSAMYYMMTESGVLYAIFLDQEGYLIYEEITRTSVRLEGFSDVTGDNKASMVYDEETGFLFIAIYDGNGETASLIAVDANDPTRCAVTGDFGPGVWPVVGLYEYEPCTDLTLKVDPTELELFETQTATVNIKIKMGETNEYTAVVADPAVCSFEDGVVTGLKEGETTVTVTTVDVNEAGEHLSATINVVVHGLKSLDVAVKGQVTDDKGARFANILLDGPVAAKNGIAAPGDVLSGGRGGDLYIAGVDTTPYVLDAETFEEVDTYEVDPFYANYPAMDIANYPIFVNEYGELDTHKFLFTTSIGWLVTPDYYGWNLSYYLPDMAAIAFGGTSYDEEDTPLFVYYLLTSNGILYEIDVDYQPGSLSLNPLLDTGITVEDPNALSMAWITTANLHGDWDLDLGEQGLVIANNEDQTMWFIDFQTGEVSMIGTLDSTNVSGLIGSFDDLADVSGEVPEPGPAPKPTITGNVITDFNFEEDPTDDGWIFVDADEDGWNWFWNLNTSGYEEIESYEGSGMIMSHSYENNTGVLTPDNWAISPAIDLSEAGEDAIVSLYAMGQDKSDNNEHFAIYAGTTNNPDEMTQISEELVTPGKIWTQFTAELTDFIGEEEVYIAIRHFNTTDMYILDVDHVEILDDLTENEPDAAVLAHRYEAVPFQAPMAQIGDGMACADNVASADFSAVVERTKLGDTVNAVAGSTNAVRGELTGMPVRMVKDDTTVADGNVTIVLTEDEAVTNGLYTATYDPEVLTFTGVVSGLEISSFQEKDGVITFAFASAEEIPAASALATLSFTYEDATVDTEVVLHTVERNDDVAVAEEDVVVPVQMLHVHAYGEPEWTWNEELTEAEAKFVCECGDEQTETAEITEEVTEPAPHADGEKVLTAKVTFNGTEYTDTKTITLEALPCPCAQFEDMPAYGTPEHEAIDWAFTHEPYQVTAGMSATRFGTGETVTRAQAMVFLWAAMGKPAATSTENPFEDVQAGKWYTDAILWAVEKGITSGTDATHFSPNKTCNRGEILTFLYATKERPAYTIDNPYTDVPENKWYEPAALWAYENGIEKGENGQFNYRTDCTRDSTVLYIYRALEGKALDD